MRWLVLLAVVAVAGSAVYYKYEEGRPCAAPIVYSIGTVDSRFGVNAADLKRDLSAAAKIWDTAAGKTLFTYADAGGVKVNLVYDEREASAKLGTQITMQQASADANRASIDAEHAQIETDQNALNAKVEQINARGGATPSERAEIQREQQALDSRIAALNDDVAAFNGNIRAINGEVAEFNQTAGHLFEEGEYMQDSSGRRINIYEFVGTDQLERVLAHELGHAVGLDHNGNPDSIMYANNESGNLVPTADDIAALKSLCGLN